MDYNAYSSMAKGLENFSNGIHYTIYEKMGAHPMSIDGVEGTYFAVWAPNAERVSVVGDFNLWDGRRNPMIKIKEAGIHELFIPGLKAGACYKYEIKTKQGLPMLKADPYANAAELRPNTASIITELGGFTWTDEKWLEQRKATDYKKEPMLIYEVHLGSWRKPEPDGEDAREFYTYRELAPMLASYVKEMGYTHVELMPIMEHPLDESWGYQVTGYYAPSSRYGTPHDFMALVDALHDAGIGVIMDWVPAHFPKDEFGLYEYDGACCYEYSDPAKWEHKDWGTRVFDFGRTEVQSFLVSSANFWAHTYHIDGIRVDAVASMLYLDYGRQNGEWTPNVNGGRENLEAVAFLRKLNSSLLSEHQGFLMIAEESTAWPLVTRPPEVGGLGFNFKWNMGWMNDTLFYTSLDPYFRSYNHDKLTFSMMYAFSENFILPISHDEVVHGKGSLLGKMPGDYNQKFAGLRTFMGYMMTHPGKKLLFMGCEFAQFIEWDYRKELDWLLLDYDSHRRTRDFIRALNHYYLAHPALWQVEDNWEGFRWLNADDNTRSVITYYRTDEKGRQSLVLCNFAAQRWEDYRMGVPQAGSYRVALCSEEERYGGAGFDCETAYRSEETPLGQWADSITLDVPPLCCIILEPINTEKE